MLPNRRLIIAVASICGLFILYSGASLWAGFITRDSLTEQHKMLAELPLFQVKSYRYERGWFSSTETTELTFNRKLIGPYENMLPENSRALLDSTIKFTNQISHGPLPGIGSFNFRPGRALVKTQFAMSEATRKTLSSFFGEQDPITIINHLGLGGGGELNINIPSFDYEEALSGVKMKWKGFKLTLDYSKDYKENKSEAISPGFLLEAASKGTVAFSNVRYVSDTRPGRNGNTLGTNELTIGDIQLQSRENIPYSIKLNELIFLMTRVRVGEFINPSGEFKPSTVSLKNFRYQMVTSEQEDFINARGKLNFQEFSFNDSRYGPMRLDVSASHLHGPSLLKLDQAISKIPFEGVDPIVVRKQYIDVIKTHGMPLLQNDPKIVINDFALKMPSGEMTLQGNLGLKGLQTDDLKHLALFWKRVEAEAKVSIPRQTLENLMIAQARNLFMVDASAEEQPDMAQVEDFMRKILDSQLAVWKAAHYIWEEKGQIRTELNYRDGVLKVNKQKVPLPWEESDGEMIDLEHDAEASGAVAVP